MPDEERILAELTRMLVEIIGEDYVLALSIGMDTSFDADLELESIEFVRLAGKITQAYGSQMNFVAFLADKEIGEIIKLTVGDLVRHIANGIAAPITGTAHG